MRRQREMQRGQVIVFLAVAVIGLLGLGALAIDGGMLYAYRRQAQSAADAAALAAALSKLNGATYAQFSVVAVNRAKSNGFDPATDPTVSITVYNPAIIPPFNDTHLLSSDEMNQYIEVRISGTMKPALAQFIFRGPLRVTVDAVARARPGVNLADGFAMYSTSTDDCRAMWFSGNGRITIHGGNLFDNSNGTDSSTPGCPYAGYVDGSSQLHLANQRWYSVGPVTAGDNLCYDPPTCSDTGLNHVYTGQAQQVRPVMPEPPCSGPNYANQNINGSGTTTLDPGTYAGIHATGNGTINLNPGTYCFTGDVSINGPNVNGAGVMLKMVSGSLYMNSNSNLSLQAPTTGDFANLLVYGTFTPAGVVPLIHLNGSSNATYTGTIYAPETTCDLNGNNGSNAFYSQLICSDIKINGTSTYNMNYSRDLNYRLPKTVELAH